MHECARRFVFLIVFTDFDIMSMVDRKASQPSYALLYNTICFAALEYTPMLRYSRAIDDFSMREKKMPSEEGA